MGLFKDFRAHQRQLMSIRLINVDILPEQRFAGLCLDEIMQYCLPYKMKILKQQSPGNGVVYCDITNPGSARPVIISRILI